MEKETLEAVIAKHSVAGTSGGYGGIEVACACGVNGWTGAVRKWRTVEAHNAHVAKKIRAQFEVTPKKD